MVVDITANVKNLEKIQKDLWPEKVTQALDISIAKVIVALDREARIETPVWVTGLLRGGYKQEYKSLYWRLFNTVNYASDVHDWTGPHFVPFDDIESRAKLKWLNAYAVQWSIGKKWTQANPFMDRAIDNTDGEIDRIFQWEIDKMILSMNA